jgi:SAM-dependent methyltransferase
MGNASPRTPRNRDAAKPADADAPAIFEAFVLAPRFQYRATRFLPRVTGSLLNAYWHASRRISNLRHEHNIDTTQHEVSVEHYHPDRVWYVPSSWSFLEKGLRGREITPRDVFVDYGCGKGRVLFQAAQHPFGRVVGVEISPALSEVARANLELNRTTFRCPDVDLVTGDATEFEVPDEMTVAYMWHPFVGDTFRRVIDNIVASLEQHPRRLRLIYVTPVMADYISSTARFELVKSFRIVHERSIQRINVYESL